MRGLRIVDDTGSLFAPPPTEFRAGEIGRGISAMPAAEGDDFGMETAFGRARGSVGNCHDAWISWEGSNRASTLARTCPSV